MTLLRLGPVYIRLRENPTPTLFGDFQCELPSSLAWDPFAPRFLTHDPPFSHGTGEANPLPRCGGF
jgi:hypothetical protein